MFLWAGELVWMPINKSSAIEMASCDAFLEDGKHWVSLPHGGTQMVACSTQALEHCFLWFSLYSSKLSAAAGRLLRQKSCFFHKPRQKISQM